MRVAILDDVHRAYEGTPGVGRLRDRAEVQIFTGPFGDPAVLRGFLPTCSVKQHDEFFGDVRALVMEGAEREVRRFEREVG